MQFSAPFKCTNCAQEGVRVWEESDKQSRIAGEGRKLVSVSEGFHIETGRTASGEPLIVCDVCDEFQLD
jgi:hypothetical protein